MSFVAGSLLGYVLEQPLDLWMHFAVGVFPFLFSVVFFAVPLVRVLVAVGENAQRAVRNSWRFLQREIYERAWLDREVTASELVAGVTRKWPAGSISSMHTWRKADYQQPCPGITKRWNRETMVVRMLVFDFAQKGYQA